MVVQILFARRQETLPLTRGYWVEEEMLLVGRARAAARPRPPVAARVGQLAGDMVGKSAASRDAGDQKSARA